MIYKNTYLIPADRCGVFWVKTFHLYGGSFRKVSYIGDFIKVSVRDTKSNNKLKKKVKLTGIIIRVKKEIKNIDYSTNKFKTNNLILLKRRMTPKGQEVIGPVTNLIKRKKFKSSFAKII